MRGRKASYLELMLERIESGIADYCEDNDLELKWSPKNLSERYSNFYGKFQYLVMDDDIYVSMNRETFKTFEYYLGMEYDRDCISLKIEDAYNITVIYENSTRLQRILDIDEEEVQE
jgi:hypothetical protein